MCIGVLIVFLLWIGKLLVREYESDVLLRHLGPLQQQISYSRKLRSALDNPNHQGRYSKKQQIKLEKLGSLYYNHQMRERNLTYLHDLLAINPNFPCVRGVIPIGHATEESISDGHKFGCGIQSISSAPIVFSFGSNRQIDFEEAFLDLRPDSIIHIFEIKASSMPNISESHKHSIHAHNIGLGYSSPELRSLEQVMKDVNVSYIDVLKMDIEGEEWNLIKRERHIFPRIGQLLLELHIIDRKHKNPIKLLEILENSGLKLFHRELNKYFACCVELSFVQVEWTRWNDDKQRLLPL